MRIVDNHGANHTAWWQPYWQLIIHVLPGLGLFFILAIPAIGLDLANQGVEMIEFQRVTVAHPSSPGTVGDGTNKGNEESPKIIRVSKPVRYALVGVEYLLLVADVILTVAVLLNGMWVFLKGLNW